MEQLIIGVFEQGFIYAIMALGVYITYKILDFPDLSVDSTFPLGAAVTTVMLSSGKNPLLALIAATGLLGNISMWSYLPKFLVKVNWKSLSVKHHYQQTFVYFIPTIATSIYTVLDKAMIGWITQNDFENGYYEQATKILNICKTLVFSINTVVSSRISFLFAKEAHVEIKQKLETTMNFILFLSIRIFRKPALFHPFLLLIQLLNAPQKRAA